MAKFASERDEFLLTLAPPTLPLTPPYTTPVHDLTVPLEEEEADRVPELHNPVAEVGRPASPLLARTSLRNKLAGLSRRASLRAGGSLRRGNTQGSIIYPQ